MILLIYVCPQEGLRVVRRKGAVGLRRDRVCGGRDTAFRDGGLNWGCFHPGGSASRRAWADNPRSTCGLYASYWNDFLFEQYLAQILLISAKNFKCHRPNVAVCE